MKERKFRGIEFSVQKKSSDIPHYALLSVTCLKTKFTPLDGVERKGNYDQKWIVNLSVGYMLNDNWQISSKFRFSTGSPYTPFDNYGGQSVLLYNTQTLPDNHSLDIRVERKWTFESMDLIAYVDIQNIYNRKNRTSVRWDYEKMKIKDESSIGLLPSIGISLEF